MEYGFFKTLKKQFSKLGFKVYLLYLLNMIAAALLPIISLFMLQTIIDSLGDSFAETRNIILIVSAILIVLGVISSITNSIYAAVFLRIRMKKFYELVGLYNRVDYELVESVEFNKEYQYAERTFNGDWVGYQGTFSNIFKMLPNILALILYAVILIKVNFIILIACLISSILGLFVNIKMFKYNKSRNDDIRKYSGRIYYFDNTLIDYHYGKDIRTYNMQDFLKDKYDNEVVSYKKVLKDIANRKFLLGFLELLSLIILDSASFILIIYAYTKGDITIGQVSLFLGIVIALSTSIKTIADQGMQLVRNVAQTSDYYKFDDKYSKTNNWGDIKALEEEQLSIEFKNVSFKYPNTDKYVIKNLDFKIDAGEKLAIVGENGAGKTTLIKLICGLFKPTEGEILINGINITSFNKEEYFKMIACVFQDYHIYSGTILENVCGTNKDDISINKAKEALNMMGLKDKIESLPNKYDQQLLKVIEEDGIELSGGESQKIAISRALYKDGKIIILDEPTAALDALAEANIYESFSKLTKNKTTIYISHRLSSTKFCDHIALFSKDGLLEYGTHEELMAKQGHYYEMYSIQGKYYKESD